MAYKKGAKKARKTYRAKANTFGVRVKRVVNNMAETKFWLKSPTLASSDVLWVFASALSGLQQGTANINRIGNSVYVKRIDFWVNMTPKVAAVNASGSACRFVIYHSKEAAGALPSGSTVWDSDSFHTLQNMNYRPKFTILADRVHSCNILVKQATTVDSAGPRCTFTISIFPRKKVFFSSNAVDSTALLRDDWGFGYVGSDAAAFDLNVKSKVHFTDV